MNGLVTKTPIKADSNGQVPTTINLLKAGTWNTPWHGDFELSGEDLNEMVVNFDEGVGLVLEQDTKAPVNYGHLAGDKAAGWMKRLYVDAVNGAAALMADVEWTPAAEQAIKDREWSYISPEFNPRGCPWEDPEQEFTFVDNVLTGAALTNIPLFKKLKPITASRVPPSKVTASQPPDESENSNQGEHMKLEDILAKQVSERSEEEKTFLGEHSADLTDEQKTQLETEVSDQATKDAADKAAEEQATKEKAEADAKAADEEAARVEASRDGKAVTINADRLAKLEADAKAGLEASRKLEEKEVDEFLTARVKAGQIKQDRKDSMAKILLASRGETRQAFEAELTNLPINASIGQELGDAGKEVAFEDEIDKRVEERIKASNGTLTYSAALKQLMASDKEFRERINAERTNQNKES